MDISGDGLHEHRVGDTKCCQGWCCGGTNRYPAPCKCGGLIHADFGDEGPSGWWLRIKCDRCGDDYYWDQTEENGYSI